MSMCRREAKNFRWSMEHRKKMPSHNTGRNQAGHRVSGGGDGDATAAAAIISQGSLPPLGQKVQKKFFWTFFIFCIILTRLHA